MDKQDILARLEIIIDNPATSNEDKIALKEGCILIRKSVTRQEFVKAIEFIAAILAITEVVRHLIT